MPLVRRKPGGFPAIITSQKPDGPSVAPEDLPSVEGREELDDEQIVQILEGYRLEAEYARLAGPNSRDLTWLQHLDLYYNRFDFSRKAAWQAREVLPEFPQYVDRFATALRMALMQAPFFNVAVDNDSEGTIAGVIEKFMNVLLRRLGRTPSGHPSDFSALFEEAMKMGAMSLPIGMVTYKDGGDYGYTSLDLEDPYNWWFDPTGRGLYRIRRVEMDYHELRKLLDLRDGQGTPVYKTAAVERAIAGHATVAAEREAALRTLMNASTGQSDGGSSINVLMRAEREKRTGTGQWIMSNRRPVILHEYLCTLVDSQGYVHGENVLCVVAEGKTLIRGPEKNPFWHNRDWVVAAPIITVPMAPYGRAYAENFSSIVKTFNEMTNLILDGILVTTMKCFTTVPGILENPADIEEGIYPNANFRIQEGFNAKEFMQAIDLGSLDPQAFPVWQMLKKELQEGAAFNDITLGQNAPKGRTSATEINSVDTNATQYLRAIASNVEKLWLEPVLDLIWKTAIQHLDKKDDELRNAIGDEWFETFLAMKHEFATYRITFNVQGISNLLARKQQLQELLQILQIVAGSPPLAQAMLQKWSPDKLFDTLARLAGVDTSTLEMSDQEKMFQQQQQQEQIQGQQQAEQQQVQQKADVDTKGKMALETHKQVLQDFLQRRAPPPTMGPQMKPGPGGQQPLEKPPAGPPGQ